MNTKHIQFKEQTNNEKKRKSTKKIKQYSKKSLKINNYQVTTERPISDTNQKKNGNVKNNKNSVHKIIIPVVILLGIGLIIAIILLVIKYFKKIENQVIEQKKNIITISTSDFDYKKAESLIGLESIKSNHFILNETINNIIDSLILCENIDIKPINTEINYTIPIFLRNPTNGALKIVKSDIEFYKDKYEKLSEKSNRLTEIANKSIDNIHISLIRTKDEIETLFYQFEEMIKNLSIPFLLKEMFFDKKNDIRILDEIDIDEDQLQIINQLEDYKNDIDTLNTLYNDYFNYINETVRNISDEINEIPNTAIDLQNKTEEGKSNFENKTNDFTNPNDIQSLHSNLIDIKNDFSSIKDEATNKQNIFGRNENKYRTNRTNRTNNNLGDRNFINQTNEIINNMTGNYATIVSGMVKYTEKKTKDKVEVRRLYGSNIIVESIKESLDLTEYIIKNEDNLIYNELKEFIEEINVEERTSLDLLFIMDITGSMIPYLTQVKNSVINIINRIVLECPGIDINIGYIAYTESNEIENNVNIEFTKNYQDLKNIIQNVKNGGGGDLPEDIAWGMERALEKNWKSNARFAILIADAPCHGIKYHLIPVIFDD